MALCGSWDSSLLSSLVRFIGYSVTLHMKRQPISVSPSLSNHVLWLVTQTLCNPMDCSPPGSSVHEDSPGKNTRVGCHALLQETFPTQRSNPGLPPGFLQVDSLMSESPGKPKNTGVGGLSLLQGICSTQELNWGLLHCRWILYQLSYQGSPYLTIWHHKRSRDTFKLKWAKKL